MLDQYFLRSRRGARSWAPSAFLLLTLGCATSVEAATHFVIFVNDSDRTVTSIEATPVGTHRWHALDLGGPLVGGRSGQADVRFGGAEPCKEDLGHLSRDGTIDDHGIRYLPHGSTLPRESARKGYVSHTDYKGKMTPVG